MNFKTIGLLLLVNLWFMISIGLTMFVVQNIFWIQLTWPWISYVHLLIGSWIIWFTSAFLSLFSSKWIAKMLYSFNMINEKELYSYPKEYQNIYLLVEKISKQEWIKTPEVGIYESEEPNAFATWPSKNNSLVWISTGLLEIMTNDEIEGVVAHEMWHIVNWDMVRTTLIMGVVNTLVDFVAKIIGSMVDSAINKEWNWHGIIYSITYFVLSIILSIFAMIIVNYHSRTREFIADKSSANYVWKEKMIASLRKLKEFQDRIGESDWKLEVLKINSKGWFMNLFSTHPPLDERIEALKYL